MLSDLHVEVDTHGFVSHACITAAPSAVAIPGPPVDDLAQLFEMGYYLEAGEWKSLGTRPSTFHFPDPLNKSWAPDAALARKSRHQEIAGVLALRLQAPITFDGKRLDGSTPSQKNLADKLAGVQQRIRLNVGMAPELMVWKDADNVVHTWTDLQAYCDWLAGYVIALEDRGTRLYSVAWQHKANLSALTDIDSLLAYDINLGWPE